MRHVYLILFALILSFSAVAQSNYKPGYIRKADGSMEQGLLDYRSDTRLTQRVSFKVNDKAKEIIFEPGQLTGYGFEGGKRYETHIIAGVDSVQQPYFLEVLVKGAANLYYTKQNAVERFFIQKGEQQPLLELV